MFTSDVIARLRAEDRHAYQPHPRELLRSAPSHALLIVTDGITPEALHAAHTPSFDALAAGGVQATDARTVFPTITGPAHTSLLTGARVDVHGFLYPKLLDAYRNRLVDFPEGQMRAETIAEAWRPLGLTSVAVGSRFLRGADAMFTEGLFGQDFLEITDRAIRAVEEWRPNLLMVVFYVADSFGHLFGPEAPETLAAIEQMDTMTARLLNAYSDADLLDRTVVAVLADHGMMQVEETVESEWGDEVGALSHGRVALIPDRLSTQAFRRLLADSRVDSVLGRPELELLRAWGPSWGEHVVLLKKGYVFPTEHPVRGFHGGWSRVEQNIPLILSGTGIRAGATLETCEIIDVAPTLSFLLGGDTPAQAEGQVLWQALDVREPILPAPSPVPLRDDRLARLLKEARENV